jgi:hypothetical protein
VTATGNAGHWHGLCYRLRYGHCHHGYNDAALKLCDVRKAQIALNLFKTAAKWFPDEKVEAEEMTGFLEGMWSSMGKEVERPSAMSLTKAKATKGKHLCTWMSTLANPVIFQYLLQEQKVKRRQF